MEGLDLGALGGRALGLGAGTTRVTTTTRTGRAELASEGTTTGPGEHGP